MTQSDLKSPPKLTDGILLAAVATLGPFAANTYVPAFGDIERDFGVSAIAVQQSLSLYLLAFACASLLIGALSDAFGRRRVLIAATLIFGASGVIVGKLLRDNPRIKGVGHSSDAYRVKSKRHLMEGTRG